MKVLVIAYSCEPIKGSEPDVGWNWAINLSKYVKVTVLTRSNNENSIRKYLSSNSLPNLSFIYFDIPFICKIKNRVMFGIQIYYLLWEYFALSKIKDPHTYSLIQRITFVSSISLIRMYMFKIPYIMSFTAGGEKSPESILECYHLKDRIKEKLRNYYNSAYKYIPVTRKIFDNSAMVLSVTDETKVFMKDLGYKGRIRTEPAIGIKQMISKKKQISKSYKLMYAGSLIYLKNIDIIIRSVKRTNIQRINLDIYGSGQDLNKLQRLTTALRLNRKIFFLGEISRIDLLQKMNEANVFVFASSHDSGGIVLLEAINAGLPVIFLDTGGPKEIFRDIDSLLSGCFKQ